MSDPKDFNPFDPISAAMGAMHGQNLLAAKDARIKQLEQQVESYRAAVMVGVTENARLKAEVERLTEQLNYRKAIAIRVGIEAAKEGKPSV
jgi:regulator of replication initiation timing